MSTDNDIKTAREGVALVGDIIKAAGDNPNVKEAGSNLGKAALTITETINNALLPLAAINYSFDKARKYFAKNFQEDLSEKASDIPLEDIIEPKASIAGPALQGLAFTHEEENLKDMYLSLLATAMNGTKFEDAHPAFVEIIRQLSSDEAHLLQVILKSENPLAVCEIRLEEQEHKGWKELAKHIVNLTNSKTGEPMEYERIPSMIENWIRLGLVEVDYTKFLRAEDSYSWIESRPEVLRFREEYENDKNKVIFQNGIIIRTSFGNQFSKAVGIQ